MASNQRHRSLGRCNYCHRQAVVRFSHVSKGSRMGRVIGIKVHYTACAEHEGCPNWLANRALHPTAKLERVERT